MALSSRYEPHALEEKWQKIWAEKGSFDCDVDSTKPKYFHEEILGLGGVEVAVERAFLGPDLLPFLFQSMGFVTRGKCHFFESLEVRAQERLHEGGIRRGP